MNHFITKTVVMGLILSAFLVAPDTSRAASDVSVESLRTLLEQVMAELRSRESLGTSVDIQTVSVDLKADGQDNNLSIPGRESVNFTWSTEGVKNCHLYVAGAKSYKIRNSIKKTINIDPAISSYVTLSCNTVANGSEISDTINVYDPKGIASLSVKNSNTFSVNATALVRAQKCHSGNIGTIDWGDSTVDNVVAEVKTSACLTEASDQMIHAYTKAGDYWVTFKSIYGTAKKVKVEIGA